MLNTLVAQEKSSVIANLVTTQGSAASRALAAPVIEAPALETELSVQGNNDVLVQLRANLAQLDDLHGRLKHLMGELSYLLRKPEF